ncbi:STAS domain-containing protein [Streptomyces sp. NPDC003401]
MNDDLPRVDGAPVPVLRPGDVLLLTLQGDLHDGTAEQLRQDTGEPTARSRVAGVVIDISGVEAVGSFPGRVPAEIAADARLPGARTVVAAMRPAVAFTPAGPGLTPPGPRTALSTEAALELLGRTDTAAAGGPRRECR